MRKLFFLVIISAFAVAACLPGISVKPKVTSFEQCVAEGNPVMESYPRQCRSQAGDLFVEEIKDIPKDASVEEQRRYISSDPDQCKAMFFVCEEDEQPFFNEKGCGCQKKLDPVPPADDDTVCTQIYDPVCGLVDVQCIKAPCPPLWQTFPNECFAELSAARDIRKGTCEDLGLN